MILEDKITEMFCVVDEFYNEYCNSTDRFLIGNKSKHPPKIFNRGIITITILFHISGYRCFKHFFLFYVQKHLSKEFPVTVSYYCFTEILQQNLKLITLFLKTCSVVWGKCNGISFIDPTPIRVCKTKGLREIKYLTVLPPKANQQ